MPRRDHPSDDPLVALRVQRLLLLYTAHIGCFSFLEMKAKLVFALLNPLDAMLISALFTPVFLLFTLPRLVRSYTVARKYRHPCRLSTEMSRVPFGCLTA